MTASTTGVQTSLVQEVTPIRDLRVHVYADGADRDGILRLNADPLIRGITTNPSLMRKAGVLDYERFARDVLLEVTTKPISFEVSADEPEEMARQARRIAAWGSNVFVKIPATDASGASMAGVIGRLSAEGIKINVTAVLTIAQVRAVAKTLDADCPSIVSVFAGRIADSGRDPEPIVRNALAVLEALPQAKLLWASVREVFNIYQADRCGCHIVTVPHEILNKALRTVGSDLELLSRDTVRMFIDDASAAGYRL